MVYNTYAVKLNYFYKPGISFVDNYAMVKVCLYFKTVKIHTYQFDLH